MLGVISLQNGISLERQEHLARFKRPNSNCHWQFSDREFDPYPWYQCWEYILYAYLCYYVVMESNQENLDRKIKHQPGKIFDDVFRTTLYVKGLHGLLEIAGGIFLLVVRPEQLNSWAQTITRGELSQDSHDFIANHILKSAHNLTGASLLFGALYLLSHGIVKLVLVVEVLRDHLWAYIALIVVTTIFVIYQIYRLTSHLSFGLSMLTILDLLIIYLTWREYGKHKLRRVVRADVAASVNK